MARKTKVVDSTPDALKVRGYSGPFGRWSKHVGIDAGGSTSYRVVVARRPFGAPWAAMIEANGTPVYSVEGSDVDVATKAEAECVRAFGPF